MVEPQTHNLLVVGSIPTGPTTTMLEFIFYGSLVGLLAFVIVTTKAIRKINRELTERLSEIDIEFLKGVSKLGEPSESHGIFYIVPVSEYPKNTRSGYQGKKIHHTRKFFRPRNARLFYLTFWKSKYKPMDGRNLDSGSHEVLALSEKEYFLFKMAGGIKCRDKKTVLYLLDRLNIKIMPATRKFLEEPE